MKDLPKWKFDKKVTPNYLQTLANILFTWCPYLWIKNENINFTLRVFSWEKSAPTFSRLWESSANIDYAILVRTPGKINKRQKWSKENEVFTKTRKKQKRGETLTMSFKSTSLIIPAAKKEILWQKNCRFWADLFSSFFFALSPQLLL